MNKTMKTLLLGLGATGAVAAPVAALVACGSSNDGKVKISGVDSEINLLHPLTLIIKIDKDVKTTSDKLAEFIKQETNSKTDKVEFKVNGVAAGSFDYKHGTVAEIKSQLETLAKNEQALKDVFTPAATLSGTTTGGTTTGGTTTGGTTTGGNTTGGTTTGGTTTGGTTTGGNTNTTTGGTTTGGTTTGGTNQTPTMVTKYSYKGIDYDTEAAAKAAVDADVTAVKVFNIAGDTTEYATADAALEASFAKLTKNTINFNDSDLTGKDLSAGADVSGLTAAGTKTIYVENNKAYATEDAAKAAWLADNKIKTPASLDDTKAADAADVTAVKALAVDADFVAGVAGTQASLDDTKAADAADVTAVKALAVDADFVAGVAGTPASLDDTKAAAAADVTAVKALAADDAAAKALPGAYADKAAFDTAVEGAATLKDLQDLVTAQGLTAPTWTNNVAATTGTTAGKYATIYANKAAFDTAVEGAATLGDLKAIVAKLTGATAPTWTNNVAATTGTTAGKYATIYANKAAFDTAVTNAATLGDLKAIVAKLTGATAPKWTNNVAEVANTLADAPAATQEQIKSSVTFADGDAFDNTWKPAGTTTVYFLGTDKTLAFSSADLLKAHYKTAHTADATQVDSASKVSVSGTEYANKAAAYTALITSKQVAAPAAKPSLVLDVVSIY